MFKPINDNLLIEYTIPEELKKYVYPITPDEKINMSDVDSQMYPELDEYISFEDAITKDDFHELLIGRLGFSKYMKSGVIKQASEKNQDLVGQEVFLENFFPGVNKRMRSNELPKDGKISHKDIEYHVREGLIQAIIKKSEIIAMIQEEKFKPVSNYVELEIEFDEEILNTQMSSEIKMSLKDLLIDEEARKNIKKEFFWQMNPVPVTNFYAKISAVGDAVTEVKVGDTVEIAPGLTLNKINRIDVDNKKAYFLSPVENRIIQILDEQQSNNS